MSKWTNAFILKLVDESLPSFQGCVLAKLEPDLINCSIFIMSTYPPYFKFIMGSPLEEQRSVTRYLIAVSVKPIKYFLES